MNPLKNHTKWRRAAWIAGLSTVLAVAGLYAGSQRFRRNGPDGPVDAAVRAGRARWLSDYRLTLEKEVDGIRKNLSGLTWNRDTKTLFAAINKPPALAELSVDGALLRTIPLVGFHDTEAVEYIGDGRFVVAEERNHRLTFVTVDAETRELRAEREGPRITLHPDGTENVGLEGLAWDAATGTLYAAKERDPMRVYAISGFPPASGAAADIVVNPRVELARDVSVADISSLDFDAEFGHLLVLSDESACVVEIDPAGRPVGRLSLTAAAGLSAPVPQAEGMALDDDGTLYVVSEPNRFYVFKRAAPPLSASPADG